MDTTKLVAVGLQPLQAEAYALLLEEACISPPLAAKKLGLTRSNAYKLLDRLVDMGLAEKIEQRKKFVYRPANPMGLISMLGEERNSLAAREEIAKKLLDELLSQYHRGSEQPNVQIANGRAAVINAYRQQIAIGQTLYFIRSKADIPVMGFDTMHDLRVLPAHHNQMRYGITPDVLRGQTNPEADKRSNLERTWVKLEDYSAPVEWSVSGSNLLIILFGNDPYAISISNPLIADAFRQLWSIMSTCLRTMPYYSDLPRAHQPNSQ